MASRDISTTAETLLSAEIKDLHPDATRLPSIAVQNQMHKALLASTSIIAILQLSI
jgi:hypothetical protein